MRDGTDNGGKTICMQITACGTKWDDDNYQSKTVPHI